ncbi:MAG: hypothetical protein A2020_04180 [Lentisphaerae bacterium GWF2_45_14]|nr:MAG: hypothetical protein A2020_04180 [Lentisphaerae bacterium GWF2_45_14]
MKRKSILFLGLIIAISYAVNLIAEDNLTNIAPEAKLSSYPYAGYTLRRIIDGVKDHDEGPTTEGNKSKVEFPIRTPGELTKLGATIEFEFKQPRTISGISIFQDKKQCVTAYKIAASTDGGKKYNIILAEEKNIEPKKHLEHFFPPIIVNSVRFIGLKGNGNVYPALFEFEILSPTNAVIASEKVTKEPINSIPFLKEGVKLKPDTRVEKKSIKRMDKGIYISIRDFWNLSFTNIPFEKNERFLNLIKYLKKMKMDQVIFYSDFYFDKSDLEKGIFKLPSQEPYKSYTERELNDISVGKRKYCGVLWPSKIAISYTKGNIMKDFCEAMHKNGFKVIASFGPNRLPFSAKKGYFPMSQGDFHEDNEKWPCIISDDYVKEGLAEIYREIIDSGADGVILGGDEFGCEGHRLRNVSTKDSCHEKFKKRFGYESLPSDVVNEENFRKWKIFEYEGIANLFKYWRDAVKEKNPDATVACLLIPWPFCFNNRMWSGLAYDIIGQTADMDYIATDYYCPESTIKRLIGANKNRKAGFTLATGKFNPYGPFERAIRIFGPTLTVIGQGGKDVKAIDFFHLWNIADLKKGKLLPGGEALAELMPLIERLEEKGIAESSPPKKIALLYSRASEDWWQLNHEYQQPASPYLLEKYGKDHPMASYKKIEAAVLQEQVQGYIYQKALMEFLFHNAYPYDLFYLDDERTMSNLSEYSLIIMPFPYSVSRDALRQLEIAKAKGSKILIVARKGEVDQFGNPYKEPVLNSLLNKEGVGFIDLNLNKCSGYEDVWSILKKETDLLLGKNRPVNFNNNRFDVDLMCLEKNEEEKFLILINNEQKCVDIELGVLLSPSKLYKVESIDFTGERETSINGKSIFRSEELKYFKFNLAPEAIKILYIYSF